MKYLHNEQFKNKSLQTSSGTLQFDENGNTQASEEMMELLTNLDGFTTVLVEDPSESSPQVESPAPSESVEEPETKQPEAKKTKKAVEKDS